VPLFKLVTGRFPVTPVDNGRPVALVSVILDGVPRAPPSYKRVALEFGNVKVFSDVVGPLNFVNPLPVPP
jgi:hypothetical protein